MKHFQCSLENIPLSQHQQCLRESLSKSPPTKISSRRLQMSLPKVLSSLKLDKLRKSVIHLGKALEKRVRDRVTVHRQSDTTNLTPEAAVNVPEVQNPIPRCLTAPQPDPKMTQIVLKLSQHMFQETTTTTTRRPIASEKMLAHMLTIKQPLILQKRFLILHEASRRSRLQS